VSLERIEEISERTTKFRKADNRSILVVGLLYTLQEANSLRLHLHLHAHGLREWYSTTAQKHHIKWTDGFWHFMAIVAKRSEQNLISNKLIVSFEKNLLN
jgi:hypothetical protein